MTFAAIAAALLGGPAGASAQAPINSDAALQPSKGGLILRQQFRYAEAEFDEGPADLDIQLVTSSTTAVYGVTNAFTLLANVPVVLYRRIEDNAGGGSDTDAGIGDITLLTKTRLYRNDFGPTNTARFDLLAGAELPTGQNEFSSDSVDPIAGGVFTLAWGRHFFDADALWQFNTAGGGAGEDLLRYDAAYIYRLAPERYTSPDPTAWNGLIELNGFYETNGDNELFLSPGIQYVTRRWIAEGTVQLPIWQEIDHRPETDFIVGVSFRIQF